MRANIGWAVSAAAVAVAAAGCSPTSGSVSVMMMGQQFPEKPPTCDIKFINVDTTMVNMSHHIIAQVRVSAVDAEGRMLDGAMTPSLQAVLRPIACRLGADSVAQAPSFGAMGRYGASSSVGFYILRQRETPLTLPPGFPMPPGVAPPAAAPPPPVPVQQL
jgi:hypothetical protein